jgi:hypothetical protein
MREPSLAGTRLEHHFHVCAFFSSRDEEYDTLCPFFREGLEWGEKVVHIVDAKLITEHLAQLTARGIDCRECLEASQLQVLSWEEAYLCGGSLDADRMLETVQKAADTGRAAGHPRLRIMGDMGWAFNGRPTTEQLLEYEVRVNEVLARNRLPAVCVYEMNRLSGTMMMDILRSHPLTLIGGVLHENPFYTPAELLLPQLRARRAASNVASNDPSTPAP